MKRTKPDLDRARQFLARYLPAKTRVELLQTRLQRLQDRASGPRPARIDGLPGPPRGTTGDPVGELATELEDTKSELQEARAKADAIRAEIRQEIGYLPRETENDERARLVLLGRYIDGEGWDTINELLFGDNEDYTDKQESYLRRCHKLHHKALYELSKIVMEDMK